MSLGDRVDELDLSLFDHIQEAQTSLADRRSLLALHAALAARGDFSYLEVGSYLGGSLQALVADRRCRKIASIDRRDAVSPDERPAGEFEYPDNTEGHMLECLSGVPGADFEKLTMINGTTEDLEPRQLNVDLCFIDAEHTDAAVLRDARFSRRAVRDGGVIVFHDRNIVDGGIREFLRELSHYRAYPLADTLFVVEINVPSLLSDPRVKAQVPRTVWRIASRFRAMRPALWLGAMRRSHSVAARSFDSSRTRRASHPK